MTKTRLIATSVATLCCALGIGYFVQQGGGGSAIGPAAASHATLARQPSVRAEPLLLSQVILTSAPADIEPIAARMDELPVPVETPAPMLAEPADCTVTVGASTVEPASVALAIDAPCNRNDRITVHHSGMMF
ncbi:MAG: hypothetical protein VXW58_09175, partial [Pseudomonadota bacterium]|nr:hypothetical protein [Pseudomonadota bacterium]